MARPIFPVCQLPPPVTGFVGRAQRRSSGNVAPHQYCQVVNRTDRLYALVEELRAVSPRATATTEVAPDRPVDLQMVAWLDAPIFRFNFLENADRMRS
jgi:hypothetical protein